MKTKLIALIILCAASVASHAQTTAYSGRLFVYPQGNYVKSNGAAVITATFPQQLFNWGFTSGTNVNQMNALYSEGPTTLTNGQTKTISLLAATNAFGDVLKFSRVHWMAVKAGTKNVGNIYFGASMDEFSKAFLTDESAFIEVAPGGVLLLAAPAVAGYAVETNQNRVDVQNSWGEPDALYAAPGLAIDADTTKFQTTNAITWAMNEGYWSLAATTNIAFTAADTVNIETNQVASYGVWRIQAATNGTVSTIPAATNMAYTSAALAAAAVPAAAANNIALGYVVVMAEASNTFTAGTTALTTNNATFYDAVPTSPSVATYELYIGGVAE